MMKAFLIWAKAHKYDLTVDKEIPGLFIRTHTQSAWEGWKAGASAERQQSALDGGRLYRAVELEVKNR